MKYTTRKIRAVIPISLLSMICFLFTAGSAFAAVTLTGKIIEDGGGTVVPNAQITATHTSLGQTYPTTSNANGDYTLNIPAGIYNIVVIPPASSYAEQATVNGANLLANTTLEIVTHVPRITVSGTIVDGYDNRVRPQSLIYYIYRMNAAGSSYVQVTTPSIVPVVGQLYSNCGIWSCAATTSTTLDAYKCNNANPGAFSMTLPKGKYSFYVGDYYGANPNAYGASYIPNHPQWVASMVEFKDDPTTYTIKMPVQKVTGTIRNSSGQPVPNVAIRAQKLIWIGNSSYPTTAQSDANGVYEYFILNPMGDQAMSTTLYSSNWGGSSLNYGGQVLFLNPADSDPYGIITPVLNPATVMGLNNGVDYVLPAGITLTGTILGKQSASVKAPVANTYLYMYYDPNNSFSVSQVTGTDGKYSFPNIRVDSNNSYNLLRLNTQSINSTTYPLVPRAQIDLPAHAIQFKTATPNPYTFDFDLPSVEMKGKVYRSTTLLSEGGTLTLNGDVYSDLIYDSNNDGIKDSERVYLYARPSSITIQNATGTQDADKIGGIDPIGSYYAVVFPQIGNAFGFNFNMTTPAYTGYAYPNVTPAAQAIYFSGLTVTQNDTTWDNHDIILNIAVISGTVRNKLAVDGGVGVSGMQLGFYNTTGYWTYIYPDVDGKFSGTFAQGTYGLHMWTPALSTIQARDAVINVTPKLEDTVPPSSAYWYNLYYTHTSAWYGQPILLTANLTLDLEVSTYTFNIRPRIVESLNLLGIPNTRVIAQTSRGDRKTDSNGYISFPSWPSHISSLDIRPAATNINPALINYPSSFQATAGTTIDYNIALQVNDNQPPQILSISVQSITNDQATIQWLTDEPSDSLVEYSLNPNFPSNQTLSANSSGWVTSHSITLAGLDSDNNPNTSQTYYFRVASKDPRGNGPTVSNYCPPSQNTTTCSFSTTIIDTIPPYLIAGPLIHSVSDITAFVDGQANEPVTVQIYYDPFPRGDPWAGNAFLAISSVDISNAFSTQLGVPGGGPFNAPLVKDTQYKLRLVLVDMSGNRAEYADAFRTTLVTNENPDTIPPTVINFSLVSQVYDSTTGKVRVTFYGRTDEAATMGVTVIDPATSNAYPNKDNQFIREHDVTISGLAPNTNFYATAKFIDPANNTSETAKLYFTTIAAPDVTPPVITINCGQNISFSNNSATILWTTNELADSHVTLYDPLTTVLTPKTDLGLTLNHSITYTGLLSGTEYYVSVASTDLSGNTRIYGASTLNGVPNGSCAFTTLSNLPNPPDVTPELGLTDYIRNISEHSATIYAITDTATDFLIEYGWNDPLRGNLWNELKYFDGHTARQLVHEIQLGGLPSKTRIYYRISVQDANGQLIYEPVQASPLNPPQLSEVLYFDTKDLTPPVISASNKQLEQATPAGTSLTASQLATVTDDIDSGSNLSVSYSTWTGSAWQQITTWPYIFPGGTGSTYADTLVKIDAQDSSGNSATKQITIRVQDTSAPLVQITSHTNNQEVTTSTVTISGTVTEAAGIGSVVVKGISATIGGTSPNFTFSVANVSLAEGDNTIIAVGSDVHSIQGTATLNIKRRVLDSTPPQITCPANINQSNDSGVCQASNVYLGSVTVVDDTDPSPTITTTRSDSQSLSAAYPVGTTLVTRKATDAAGNFASCTQQITITDNELPVIDAPANKNVNADPSACSALISALGTATISDNCPGAVIDGNDGLGQYPVGVTNVAWTGHDAAGHQVSDVQSVTVLDNQLPTITAPADREVNTDTTLCTASGVALGTATFDDNCPGSSSSNNAPTFFVLSDNIVTWTVTDSAGNSASATQKITVKDQELPTITAPADIMVNTNAGTCIATNVTLGNSTVTDNCGTPTASNNAPASYSLGDTSITWTVTDSAGNQASATQKVTVSDAEAPVIGSLSPLTLATDAGLCTAARTLTQPTVSDNCDSAPTLLHNGQSPYALGQTSVTWTAKDNANNSANVTQVITVEDHEKPTITLLSPISLNTDAGLCTTTISNLPQPTAVDNCPGNLTSTNNGAGTYSLGNTTVTWTVTDPAGNADSTIQQITVNDGEAPSIEAPANITAATDAGSCNASGLLLGTPTITSDNCHDATLVGNNAPTNYALGATNVVWTFSDGAGNSASATQIITVEDHEAPTIAAPATLTLYTTDKINCTAVATSLGSPVLQDNCSTPTASNNGLTSYPLGNTNVTWTAQDAAGNSKIALQTVTVIGSDLDSDSYAICAGAASDCDDANFRINPGAVEICDTINNDCDTLTDEGFDLDADGVTSCAGDCNDSNATIKTGILENTVANKCDGIDNNCNGKIDESCTCVDLDGDKYVVFGLCTTKPGIKPGVDCNDGNAQVNPGILEKCNTPYDDNCNGKVNENCDIDGDTYMPSILPSSTAPLDCNDYDATIKPGLTDGNCDGIDNDCDNLIDEDSTCIDSDGDGIWESNSLDICPNDPLNICSANQAQTLLTSASNTTMATPNGDVALQVPSGALSGNTIVTIEQTNINSGYALETAGGLATAVSVYTFSPEGTSINSAKPMRLTMYWKDQEAPNGDGYVDGITPALAETLLNIYWFNPLTSVWESQGATCDFVKNYCSLLITHFSEYALAGAQDIDQDGYFADDCDDSNTNIHPQATERCNGIDDDCNEIVDDAAKITIEAARHTVGNGSNPGSTKDPMVGIIVNIYSQATGSCAATFSNSPKNYPTIFTTCQPAQSVYTDINGMAVFQAVAGNYLAIADPNSGPVAYSNAQTYVGASVGTVACGGSATQYLQLIVKSDGTEVPGKTTKKTGSLLLIIEPAYIEWDDTIETYPFLFESENVWNTTITFYPPEGFVSNYDSLKANTPSYKAVQFTLMDVGSKWDENDQVEFTILHNGKKIKETHEIEKFVKKGSTAERRAMRDGYVIDEKGKAKKQKDQEESDNHQGDHKNGSFLPGGSPIFAQ